jgi:hypothetical protein
MESSAPRAVAVDSVLKLLLMLRDAEFLSAIYLRRLILFRASFIRGEDGGELVVDLKFLSQVFTMMTRDRLRVIQAKKRARKRSTYDRERDAT